MATRRITARGELEKAGIRATGARIRKLARVIGEARKRGIPIRANVEGLLDSWRKPVKASTRKRREPEKQPRKREPRKSAVLASGELTGIAKAGFKAGAAWLADRTPDAELVAATAFAEAMARVTIGGERATLTRSDMADGVVWEISISLTGDTRKFLGKKRTLLLPTRASRWSRGWHIAASGEPVTRGDYIPRMRMWTELRGEVRWKGFYRVGSRTLDVSKASRRGQWIDAVHTSHTMMRFASVVDVEREHYRQVQQISRSTGEPTRLKSVVFFVRYYTALST